MKTVKRFINIFIARPLLIANPFFLILYIIFFGLSLPLAIHIVAIETELLAAYLAVMMLTLIISAMTAIYMDFFNVHCLSPVSEGEEELNQNAQPICFFSHGDCRDDNEQHYR